MQSCLRHKTWCIIFYHKAEICLHCAAQLMPGKYVYVVDNDYMLRQLYKNKINLNCNVTFVVAAEFSLCVEPNHPTGE